MYAVRDILKQARQHILMLQHTKTKDCKHTNISEYVGLDVTLLHSCLRLNFVKRAIICSQIQMSRDSFQRADFGQLKEFIEREGMVTDLPPEVIQS